MFSWGIRYRTDILADRSIVFVDTEVGIKDNRIHDAGACKFDGSKLHSSSAAEFSAFIEGSEYICGHNIYGHDIKYIQPWIGKPVKAKVIDTLYMSPLLFPVKPYHKLVKDDKLQVEELNNPLNDSLRAMELFGDEFSAFSKLPSHMKRIFCSLLSSHPAFSGFFEYVGFEPYSSGIDTFIKKSFEGKICSHADVSSMVYKRPVELAYALTIIDSYDPGSITPPWVLNQFPNVENIIKLLRNTPCKDGCPYCNSKFDVKAGLKRVFGYDEFRTFDGEPLQENAARAAVNGKSLLAVFPTGGGKSITFQLPAIMAGEAAHGLTVVISPLQSLMKDQVDNLAEKGIYTAVTINGLLDPVERKKSIDLVMSGVASILYISPESLRSKTIEKMLMSRNVVRFVIDEAHCFSAWGQDFRVDYMYIGDFIKKLQDKKMLTDPIPVSCFTATAKQKVIADINDYFREKLGITLELFTTTSTRKNLHYTVIFEETDADKYQMLRTLIDTKKCSTIVYVARTAKTKEIAERLTRDGFPALPFNGKMDSDEKVKNQEAFLNNEVKIIVATSAFGMGVDKPDVKLVVHYDISDSLENYIQDAGRAGRDPSLEAECFVLYNNEDLDKHFMLLNQTKLSLSEIQQVWRAIKTLTKQRSSVSCSALEIARQAGWDDTNETETRVKTAILALENAGYVERGQNIPKVYATSILTRSMAEAAYKIDNSGLLIGKDAEAARRVLSNLISKRAIAKAGNDEAESRVDYIADRLGFDKDYVIYIINLLRQEGILSNDNDMSAFIMDGDTENKAATILRRFSNLEFYLIDSMDPNGFRVNYKELNDAAIKAGITGTNPKNIRTLYYYLTISKCIEKKIDDETGGYIFVPKYPVDKLKAKASRRLDICNYIISTLYAQADKKGHSNEIPVEFSLVGLFNGYKDIEGSLGLAALTLGDIEDALLYLSKIGAMKIEGGFLVSYNAMEIRKLIDNNQIQYKKEDYRSLNEFYQQRIQQIHIVGKYANLMVHDYDAALEFVSDYFQMEYTAFIAKYFKGKEAKEIIRNITPEKYDQLFSELSPRQREIIDDNESKYIVVAAGPGSGKTKVLVHKLASLLLMEDVKHEQLLMLTFSRAAATEFRQRLYGLIGPAAKRIDIKTFHSYCFDMLGRIGRLEESNDVIKDATKLINEGEVEQDKITRKVLVIDEAQDMSEDEFALVEALINQNDGLRVIAVGDDDQNIYEFRGSSSRYLYKLLNEYKATLYEMDDNYRSCKEVVSLANAFALGIKVRMKKNPIVSVRTERGHVALTHHSGKNMIGSLISDVAYTFNDRATAGVLTRTNNDALQIVGMLNKAKVPAKLIQSFDEFDISKIVELNYFIEYINKHSEYPVITDDLWEDAIQSVDTKFAKSKNLAVCKRIFEVFSDTYPVKYKTDLETFIKESKLEDFDETKVGVVSVSTIHKAKGREFDSVYIYLSGYTAKTDEEKHALYVGMTRAKNYLSIHYDNDLFTGYRLEGVRNIEDSRYYPEPTEMIFQLNHRSVNLGYFKFRRGYIEQLYAGDRLSIKDGAFFANIKGKEVQVGAFSKAFNESLEAQTRQNFIPDYGIIRYIVMWKGEEDTEEVPIILPDLHLKRV